MPKSTVSEVLAANLKALMEARRMKQPELARRSGVGQTTISLYMRPDVRGDGTSGKPASARIGHIELLADALGVEAWEMLRPIDSERLKKIAAIEEMLDKVAAPQPLQRPTLASVSREDDEEQFTSGSKPANIKTGPAAKKVSRQRRSG